MQKTVFLFFLSFLSLTAWSQQEINRYSYSLDITAGIERFKTDAKLSFVEAQRLFDDGPLEKFEQGTTYYWYRKKIRNTLPSTTDFY